MIKGIHAMFYSPKAEELRAFFRDKLGLRWFDSGDGWLIFKPSDSEVGCHPHEGTKHKISFYCDDLQATMEELKQRGVEFTMDIVDQGYGFVTRFRLPDGTEVDLYQPKYKE
ncbi:MAG TPA: VOC family protein [Fimbriimonadales bacterium]|nr:VOC family protein [Fimbriimonadales bacterium]